MSAMKWKVKRPNKRDSQPGVARLSGLSGDVNLLKERLLDERLRAVLDPELRRSLQLAANESAALAWTTAYPLLVLPELMAERGQATETRHNRQNCIRKRNCSNYPAAA
ncbi:MAG TPA: hypothetical protein VJS65_04570 [Verrucomicrobiae bacterium]|nr:hypothetical protein [Verrucomicrobiae bacterium]